MEKKFSSHNKRTSKKNASNFFLFLVTFCTRLEVTSKTDGKLNRAKNYTNYSQISENLVTCVSD